MIAIMIPLLQDDVMAWAYVLEYFFEANGYGVVDNFTTILDDKNQVVV
jgi:hypothetical protein